MFHGGGWMIGDISMHRHFYSNIALHLNMVVVSPGTVLFSVLKNFTVSANEPFTPEYRRSPDAGIPMAAYLDCMATIKVSFQSFWLH